MSETQYDYIIVGGGLAGASAIEGIRERDAHGSVLLLGAEEHPPYHRPPLSKDLWTGDKQKNEIFVHDEEKARTLGAKMRLGERVEAVDPANQAVRTASGDRLAYGTLLLATGGSPKRLDVPGGNPESLLYYRTLADYTCLRDRDWQDVPVVVVGAGFIGSEMAAALHLQGANVTMIFPEDGLCLKVFPEALARARRQDYEKRGVTMLAGDTPVRFAYEGDGLIMHTREGKRVEARAVVAGIGIAPATELAAAAGLEVDDGIQVNDRLRTSDPHVYAAGDNASFPCATLQRRMRIEHWDNAQAQGKRAGRNMAGADEPFTYLPFFFSDLFDFGFEAVGAVDSRLETVTDWEQENQKGVIYYAEDGRLRGALMCDVWEKVDAARTLIEQGVPVAEGNVPDLDAVGAQ